MIKNLFVQKIRLFLLQSMISHRRILTLYLICLFYVSLVSLLTWVRNYFSPAKRYYSGRNQAWLDSGKKYRCTLRSVLRFNNTRHSLLPQYRGDEYAAVTVHRAGREHPPIRFKLVLQSPTYPLAFRGMFELLLWNVEFKKNCCGQHNWHKSSNKYGFKRKIRTMNFIAGKKFKKVCVNLCYSLNFTWHIL